MTPEWVEWKKLFDENRVQRKWDSFSWLTMRALISVGKRRARQGRPAPGHRPSRPLGQSPAGRRGRGGLGRGLGGPPRGEYRDFLVGSATRVNRTGRSTWSRRRVEGRRLRLHGHLQ